MSHQAKLAQLHFSVLTRWVFFTPRIAGNIYEQYFLRKVGVLCQKTVAVSYHDATTNLSLVPQK